MMYDFNKYTDRRGTDCYKWDVLYGRYGRKDLLPFWIADAEFLSCPQVCNQIEKRAQHGIYGYTFRSDECTEVVVAWEQKRHGWTIKNEWVTYSPCIMTTVSICIECFTNPGDSVLVISPAYPPFYNKVEQNGRKIALCNLQLTDKGFTLDFNKFESAVVNNKCRLFLLCNPHNPTGRVWTREELERILDICRRHNVLIISDDIHCDIVYDGNRYIPAASLSETYSDMIITCISPGKTFNVSGLLASVAIIPDRQLRDTFNASLERYDLLGGNVFGITALHAAYATDGQWVDACNRYLMANRDYVLNCLEAANTQIRPIKPEGTYMMLLDFRAYGWDELELTKNLVHRARVVLNNGSMFGSNSQGFARFNFACGMEMLTEGLRRLCELKS